MITIIQFLKVLKKAQQASDSAKATKCNGVHRDDYEGGGVYADANYRRSRQARKNRYAKKNSYIAQAVSAATVLNIPHGKKDGVIYFVLTTGMVSFHCQFLDVRDFDGVWDEVKGETLNRINGAIQLERDFENGMVENYYLAAEAFKNTEAMRLDTEETLRYQCEWVQACDQNRHFANLHGVRTEIAIAGYPANRI